MRCLLVSACSLPALALASAPEGWKEEWFASMAQSWLALPLAREWSATLSFQAPGNTAFVNSTMSWWSSEDDEGLGPAFKLRFNRHVPKAWIGPGYAQSFDELVEYRQGTETGEGKVQWLSMVEGVKCHDEGNWDLAVLYDMQVVEGEGAWRERCSTVLASRHPGRGNVTFCLGSDMVPQRLQIDIDPAFSGETNADMYTITAAFHNVTLGPLPAETFARPGPCLEGPPPAACPREASAPTEETLTAIHFTHAPGRDCGLNNLMTNDLHGALSFGGLSSGYEFLQVYSVTVRPDFAPLQDCNYLVEQQQMVCTGGSRTASNAKSVGRSSYQYMEGAHSGQCTSNAFIGSWYSFPSSGECAAGWDVGFQGCTWKTEAFKLVSLTCMASHCGQLEREALRTDGSIITASVLACVTEAVALCPEERGAMGPTCFSRPVADVHV